MRKLYRWWYDFGRMGSLEGVFAADESEVEKLVGKKVYFGEVLGKHSEVYVVFDKEDFKVVTDDQSFIDRFVELKLSSGYDPRHYYEEEEDG